MTYNILFLPGDGVGAEVIAGVKKIAKWIELEHGINFEIEEDLIGGSSIDAHGVPITDAVISKAKSADAVMLGAVGGSKWDNLPFSKKPETGLLSLRKALDCFANIRPAVCFDCLKYQSSLRPELITGLNVLFVRELSGGVYFGEPRGIVELENNKGRRAFNTDTYTTDEVRRVARVAFSLSKNRSSHVCSMDKANVMEVGQLWREEVQWVHDNEFQETTLSHMYIDNGAMQLIRQPSQFDVVLTSNLFGDIITDCSAMLTGSLGMLPSASIGDKINKHNGYHGLYEPVHGSAPDIAGLDICNPIGGILSFAMMMRLSFNLDQIASLIENKVKSTLEKGIRTIDITGNEDIVPCSTSGMIRSLLE